MSLEEAAINHQLWGLRLGGPSGNGPVFRFRSLQVDRRAFDSAYAARASGAELQTGVTVERALHEGGVATLSGPLRARITIFADGADCAVRGILPTMRNEQDVAWGHALLLEGPGLGAGETFEVRLGSLAPGWRAQYNPLGGERANLWTFIRGVDRSELAHYAQRALETILGDRSARTIEELQGADPASVLPRWIAGDGVMACGAAAGQGGLEAGARSGLLAGRVVARALAMGDISRRSLRAYERSWWRKAFTQVVAVRYGIGALTRLSDGELEEMFGAMADIKFEEEDLVAMLRGDPRGGLRKTGLARAVRVLSGLVRGWQGLPPGLAYSRGQAETSPN